LRAGSCSTIGSRVTRQLVSQIARPNRSRASAQAEHVERLGAADAEQHPARYATVAIGAVARDYRCGCRLMNSWATFDGCGVGERKWRRAGGWRGVRNSSWKDRDLSAISWFFRMRNGDARHARRAPSVLDGRSASACIAACRRRTSFSTAAPLRGILRDDRGGWESAWLLSPSLAAEREVARQRWCAGSRRLRAALGGHHPLLQVRWWRLVHPTPSTAVAFDHGAHSQRGGSSGSAPHSQSPNPSLQRTTTGRSPGCRR